MKSIAKILFVGACAVAAVSLTTVSSEAAKKKGKAAAACTPTMLCSASGKVMVCGGDGKWYQALVTPVCVEPLCPAKC